MRKIPDLKLRLFVGAVTLVLIVAGIDALAGKPLLGAVGGWLIAACCAVIYFTVRGRA